MPQEAVEILHKSQKIQDLCIAIAAFCLMLYLDVWVAELRLTQVSALLGFVLSWAPNLIAAALGPFVFLLFSTRREQVSTCLGFGLGLMLYECGQLFISWAVFDWWDLAATLVGTLLSLVFIRVAFSRAQE